MAVIGIWRSFVLQVPELANDPRPPSYAKPKNAPSKVIVTDSSSTLFAKSWPETVMMEPMNPEEGLTEIAVKGAVTVNVVDAVNPTASVAVIV
jgi:hypothetical protein